MIFQQSLIISAIFTSSLHSERRDLLFFGHPLEFDITKLLQYPVNNKENP